MDGMVWGTPLGRYRWVPLLHKMEMERSGSLAAARKLDAGHTVLQFYYQKQPSLERWWKQASLIRPGY